MTRVFEEGKRFGIKLDRNHNSQKLLLKRFRKHLDIGLHNNGFDARSDDLRRIKFYIDLEVIQAEFEIIKDIFDPKTGMKLISALLHP